jgi:hypothetical protein
MISLVANNFVLVATLLILVILDNVVCSQGDRSYVYQRCLSSCIEIKCNEVAEKEFVSRQSLFNWLLNWSCSDECKHECMWTTVSAFIKDGSPIPQFHGKVMFENLTISRNTCIH